MRYFDSLRIRTVEGRQGGERGTREAGRETEGGRKEGGDRDDGEGKETRKEGREVCQPEVWTE